MPENFNNKSEFDNRVEAERQSRIGRLADTNLNKFNKLKPSEITSFFKENKVSMESVRRFLNEKFWNGSPSNKEALKVTDSCVTLLSLNEWKQEIIAEILKKWPFNSPEKLVEAIAEYMKAKLKYNWLIMLDLIDISYGDYIDKAVWDGKLTQERLNIIFKIIKALWIKDKNIKNEIIIANKQSNKQKIKDILYKAFFDYFWDKIDLTQYHLDLFKNVISEHKDENGEIQAPYLEPFISDIDDICKKNDLKALNKYIKDNYKNSEFRKFLLNFMTFHNELRLQNDTRLREVNQILNEVKVWVCRHFSVIMKEIYNEIVKNWDQVKFSQESTMIYVSNDSEQHAYNLLIYEDKDKIDKKVYIDMTSFINWWPLFIDTPPQKEQDWEIWVRNNRNNSNRNI